jgi:hypothetical protein
LNRVVKDERVSVIKVVSLIKLRRPKIMEVRITRRLHRRIHDSVVHLFIQSHVPVP